MAMAMTLPHLGKNKTRHTHGSTNNHIPHLCRQPNPKEFVENNTFKGVDHRSLHQGLRESLVTHADTSVRRAHTQPAPPPDLPRPATLFQNLQDPSYRTNRQTGTATGLTGALPAPDGSGAKGGVHKSERLAPGIDAPQKSCFLPSDWNNQQPTTSHHRTGDMESRQVSPRSTIGTNGTKATQLFQQPQRPPQRGTTNTSSTTFSLMQPETQCSMFMNSAAQFDPTSRGLNSSIHPQLEKLKKEATREVKTVTMRNKEAGVVARRVAEADKEVRLGEGRIKSKAIQADNYQKRLASYKFTS